MTKILAKTDRAFCKGKAHRSGWTPNPKNLSGAQIANADKLFGLGCGHQPTVTPGSRNQGLSSSLAVGTHLGPLCKTGTTDVPCGAVQGLMR